MRNTYAGWLVIITLLLLGAPSLSAAQAGHRKHKQQNGGEPIQPALSAPGFSSERLSRIDSAMARAIDRHEIAGAVVLIMRDGHTVYERAFGWADREDDKRMKTNAIFRIASMTKIITSVAIMSLVEQGLMGLNDPLSQFLPEFTHTTVMLRDSGNRVVPARREITIRDLLTHTAGISYGTDTGLASLYRAKGLGPAAGFGWYTADKDEPICQTMERLATLPFAAQPGSRYVYGYSTDILGCVIERVSGMPLDAFLEKRITGPLGMHDTHFYLPKDDEDRLTTVYASTDADTVVPAPEGARGQGDYANGPEISFSGGAGLTSTASDYARFAEMLRSGGQFNGERILAPATVALMTTNQTDTLYSQKGEGFGLGVRVLLRAGGGDGRVESVGTFGWGGAYGTTFEVDPRQRLVIVFMIQQIPTRSMIAVTLPMLVYQALTEWKD